MSSSAFWMFGLALAYTLLLIVMSQIAKKKAKAGEDFFVGGRKFSRWTVAFCCRTLSARALVPFSCEMATF